MEPNKRLINAITEGNLWIYILSLGKEGEVQERELPRLIFERFGFLPSQLILKTVLFRLKGDKYISKEKLAGEPAYKTTEKGMKELEAMRSYCSNLLQKL
jgi:DNA-binding PadR family transcriptional regulator